MTSFALHAPRIAAVCLLAIIGRLLPPARAAEPAPAVPQIYFREARLLAAARERVEQGDPILAPALARLKEEADKALTLKLMSVTDKPKAGPSGDKHDYVSQAPYWWPDPSKPDGLPYIRHDGTHNPEVDAGRDARHWESLSEGIATLGQAYYFTGNEAYAERAAELARHWFLEPATRMNPNLKYAQYIPGVNDGRGAGLIDMRRLPDLCDALTLIGPSGAWTKTDQQAFHAWVSDYLTWLIDSPNGRNEAATKNNHGSWCAAQRTYLALYLGRTDMAQRILNEVLSERIPNQIEPDGREPLELARTNSLHYSLFNIEALSALARMGRAFGLDLWGHRTAEGRGLDTALQFAAPYADPAKAWVKEDIVKENRSAIVALMAEARATGGERQWDPLIKEWDKAGDARWKLLTNYPIY